MSELVKLKTLFDVFKLICGVSEMLMKLYFLMFEIDIEIKLLGH